MNIKSFEHESNKKKKLSNNSSTLGLIKEAETFFQGNSLHQTCLANFPEIYFEDLTMFLLKPIETGIAKNWCRW